MKEDTNNYINEIEQLKKTVKKLKREILINKIEFEAELEYGKRREHLINLLIPRIDMEDIVKVLFAYLIRILPFNLAYITIKKDDYCFNAEILADNANVFISKISKIDSNINLFLNESISKRKGFLINNLIQYNSDVFDKNNTCMVHPVFIGENSYCCCYFENDLEGSYSKREFEVIDEILQDTSYPILNSIEFQKKLDSNNLTIKDKNTNLYNKHYLLHVLEKQLIISKATKLPFSIISIDITQSDNDIINSTMKNIAYYFKNLIRKVDTIFKYNKNRIIILINNSNEETAQIILNRLKNRNEILKKINDEEIEINFSHYTYKGNEVITNREILEYTI